MSQFIDLEKLDQSLVRNKQYIDSKFSTLATDVEAKLADKLDKDFAGADTTVVTNLGGNLVDKDEEGAIGKILSLTATKVILADGTSEDVELNFDLAAGSGVNDLATKVQQIENTMQESDPIIDSLVGLTGTGVVKMTAADTLAVEPVGDADLKAGDAVSFAKDAFAAKDGSVKTSEITNGTTPYIQLAGGALTVGDTTQSVTFKAMADGDGKSSVYIEDATSGEKRRVATETEVKTMIDSAVAGASTYMGKFTYFSAAADAAAAKAAIPTGKLADGQKAVIFDTTAKTVETGVYNATAWTWTPAEWNNGAWAWIEDIVGTSSTATELPSGRVIFDADAKAFDVIEDREGKPDEFGLTYNNNGAICMKMITDADNYGANPVSAALNASNIGYGDGMTIHDKITAMEYTVATQEEVQAVLDRVFGKTATTP